MKSTRYLAPMLLLLASCASLQDTALSGDDVYDVPDRTAVAVSTGPEEQPVAPAAHAEDYYDAAEARSASTYRDYYDLTYNDPYYYNYGRFGFGTGIGSYGPGWGMGLSYGWPTSFGSMGIGYGFSPGMYGYDPYWNNSWMSGYGYLPYHGYDPFGYYGYGQYGYGYGGYGMGYGPYQGPWGGCYGCYEPISYGSAVYSHRPSMSSSHGSSPSISPTPRMAARNPAGLLRDSSPTRINSITGAPQRQDRRLSVPETPSRTLGREPVTRPSRNFENTPSMPSRSSGGNSGGGRVTSPRPR